MGGGLDGCPHLAVLTHLSESGVQGPEDADHGVSATILNGSAVDVC